MTRQYKSMQEELLNRINRLEGTIQARFEHEARVKASILLASPSPLSKAVVKGFGHESFEGMVVESREQT